MVNLFRRLHPFNLFWLVIVLAVLRTGMLFHLPGRLSYNLFEPFLTVQLPFNISFVFNPIENFGYATILIFIQALWLNKLVTDYNLMGKPNFMPALMLVICSSLFIPFTVISRPLLCNFFLLWLFRQGLLLYKSEDGNSLGYDMGLIIALGTLVYFPFVFMLLGAWAGMAIFRPFNWREWVAVAIGFVTVFFFLAVLYYWNDSLADFGYIWLPLGSRPPTHFSLTAYAYISLLPVGVILVLALAGLRDFFFKTGLHIRKSYQWLLALFFVAVVSYYVQDQYKVSHFLLCVVPVAVGMAFFFSVATRRWFYEGLFALLIAVILYFQYGGLSYLPFAP